MLSGLCRLSLGLVFTFLVAPSIPDWMQSVGQRKWKRKALERYFSRLLIEMGQSWDSTWNSQEKLLQRCPYRLSQAGGAVKSRTFSIFSKAKMRRMPPLLHPFS